MNRDISKYQSINKQDYEIVAGPDWPSYETFCQHNNIDNFVYDEIDQMLWNLKPFDHPTFCVLPFYGWEYPQNTPCCIIPGTPTKDQVEQIKSDMLNKKRPSSCQSCYDLEDCGIDSDRLLKNRTLDFYSNQDLQLLFDQAKQGNSSIVHYKIDTSNTCNSTCITCDGFYSTAWSHLKRKNGLNGHPSWSTKPEEIDTFVNYHTAKSIGFRGGEPFLSQANFYILEKLLEANNHTCFISFTTNGSTMLTDYQKNLLSKFKHVNFCFSIDGIGPVFEYLRYPLSWSTLLENVDYCKNNNIMASANYTISNINIYYHDQTVAWLDQNNISYLIHMVDEPLHFRAGALSKQIKNLVIQKQKDPRIQKFLSMSSNHDERDFLTFRQEISKQDRWKGINMQDYLPEFAKILG